MTTSAQDDTRALSDLAIVKRVQQGDKEAFNILVLRYQYKVCDLAYKYVNKITLTPMILPRKRLFALTVRLATLGGRAPFTLGSIASLLMRLSPFWNKTRSVATVSISMRRILITNMMCAVS